MEMNNLSKYIRKRILDHILFKISAYRSITQLLKPIGLYFFGNDSHAPLYGENQMIYPSRDVPTHNL